MALSPGTPSLTAKRPRSRAPTAEFYVSACSASAQDQKLEIPRGRRLARQVPVAALRQVVVELSDALQCRRHASRRTHQVWSLSRRAYTRTRAPHLQRRKWLRCDIVRSAAGSGVRSAPRWSLHRSFTYLLGYAHS